MIRRGLEYARQFDANLWSLSFGWFVAALGFAASMPFVSIYFHSAFDMSMTQIGVYFAVMSIVRSLCQIVGGELSDRVSRQSLLWLTQIGRGLAFVLLAATIHFEWGFWAVTAALFTATVLGAVFHPVANAMVSDILPPERRLDGYAITRSAGNLGWAAGPALGGFLAGESFGLLFLISAAITLLSALVFLIFLRAPQAAKPQEIFRLKDVIAVKDDPLLARHSILIFLLHHVVAQLIVPFSVYSVEIVGLAEHELGYLYTLNGLLVVALQLPITRLLRRFSLASQLAAGAFIYAIGYGVMGGISAFSFFAVAIVIVSIGEMAMSPPSLTLTSRLAPPGRMGRYMGVYGFFVASGWSLGPLWGGTIIDAWRGSPITAWLVIASLAVVAGLGYLAYRRRFTKATADKAI